MLAGYIPKHHCKIPDNSSIQAWIPKDEDGNYESCSIYVNSSVSNDSKATVPCTDGWDYTEADCGLTIVNEVIPLLGNRIVLNNNHMSNSHNQ